MDKNIVLSVVMPIHNPNMGAYFKRAFTAICEQQVNFDFDIYIIDDCDSVFKKSDKYNKITKFINEYKTNIPINWVDGIEAEKFDCDNTKDKKDDYKKRGCLGPANAYVVAFNCITNNPDYGENKPKYIVSISQDNIVESSKLQILYDEIEQSNYDVVFNSWKNSNDEEFVFANDDVTFDVLLKNNDMCKITNSIIRISTYQSLPFLWSQYWKSLYDFEQFVYAKFRRNIKIKIIPNILNYNKQHKEQFSKNDINRKEHLDMILNIYKDYGDEQPNLTCILMFRNEGNEIEKTIQNIRATTKNAPIVLIDDDSIDNYNYQELENIYPNVRYYRNEENYGTAYSRDRGVKETKTDYFVQLDGHMRFYNNNWVEYAMQFLPLYPDSILFARSLTIRKNKMGVYENEDGAHFHSDSCGAFINTADAYEFTSHWSYVLSAEEKKNKTLIEVPCCLGADYFSSKAHWAKIKGLQGLKQWGQEEPMMSIKTWLLGGKVILMSQMWVGHVYREKRPYPMDTNKTTYNHLLLNHLFTDKQEMADEFDLHIKKRFPKHIGGACQLFQDNIEEIQMLKNYINQNRVHDMNWFFKFNEQYMRPSDWEGDDGHKQKKLR